jgi:hypothetical protein
MDYTDCSLLVARSVISDETMEAALPTSGQTGDTRNLISALRAKANFRRTAHHVRLVPKGDITPSP